MGLCVKCTVLIAVGAVVFAVLPIIINTLDNRPYNGLTTAEQAAEPNQFAGQTVIVTGASDGIGIPTAKVLYENGATVIMACRNPKKADKARQSILSSATKKEGVSLKQENLKVMVVDLASLKSVKSFADSFTKSYDSLNILINNAGVMALDDFTLSPDGVESQFAINNLGHFYLTRLLTPLLVKSSSTNISRVINTASLAHAGAPSDLADWLQNVDRINNKTQYAPWARYSLTKALNLVFGKAYNDRFASKGVYSMSLHPGAINTGLQRYNKWAGLISKYAPKTTWMKTVSQGAATQLRAAAIPDDEFKQYAGQYWADCNPAKSWVPALLDAGKTSDELGTLFWNLCEAILKTKGFE